MVTQSCLFVSEILSVDPVRRKFDHCVNLARSIKRELIFLGPIVRRMMVGGLNHS